MTCPRCGSRSVYRDHHAVACLSCGRVIDEPARDPTEATSLPRGAGPNWGPPWTESERLLWEQEKQPAAHPAPALVTSSWSEGTAAQRAYRAALANPTVRPPSTTKS